VVMQRHLRLPSSLPATIVRHTYITAILRDQGMLLGPDQTEELTQGFFTVTVVSGRSQRLREHNLLLH
jgi:glycerol-3-phosphate dehydrogenase